MRLFSRLHGRVAALTVAIAIVLLCITVIGIDMALQLYHQEANQRLNRDLAQWLVSHYRFERNGALDTNGVSYAFDDAMRINPGIEVYLLDEQGAIRAFNAPPGRVKVQRVDLAPIKRMLAGDQRLPILGTNPRNPGSQQIFSVAPISNAAAGTIGYAYIVVGSELYQSSLARIRSSHIMHLTVLGAGGVMLAGALMGFAGFWFLTRRIVQLGSALEDFMAKGFDVPPVALAPHANLDSGDEIDRLRARTAELARVVHEHVLKLRIADAQLRETVAGLTHDLRTPLTALGGYLDTVLLGRATLLPAQSHHYVELAAAQHRRLSSLVRAQFELSLLDTATTPFEPQAASLSDLVTDIAQKFEGLAQNAGVVLAVEMPQMNVSAYVDVGLIERVLENLLSNALAHTPRGGRVVVALAERAGRVRVTVTDSGTGIDATDLPHIFERGFRSKRAAQTRGEGAGLGLAIAQRIVAMHGASINVQSEPGKGARFSFDLPTQP